ncbi:unnamed protein product [Alopecurus aequalis]
MAREKQQQRKRKKSPGQLRFPEIKKQKQCNPYDAARSIPCDCNFWDNRQKELYDQIYRNQKVFKHRFVEWSEIDDAETCPFDVSTKYEDLGLKGLASDNSSWVWNEDVLRQFYGTLYVDPKRKEMDFMIGSHHCFATKEDLEKALLIEPRADSLVLHTWNDVDVHSLFLVPNLDSSLVRDLKTEVDLIQKINRNTLLPRSGSRGSCSIMLLKLAYAIYHGNHFDIAHFLLSEMCEAIETPNHALPYAPHIFCLLRHLKLDLTNIETNCYLKKYTLQLPKLNSELLAALAEVRHQQPEVTEVLHQQPEVTEVLHQQPEVTEVPHQQLVLNSCQPQQTVNPDLIVASIAQLSKMAEGLHEIVVKGLGTMEKRLDTMEDLFSDLSSEVSEIKAYMSDPCHVLSCYKQKRAQTEGGDGSCAATDP